LVLKNAKKYPKGPATVFRLLKEHDLFLQEFKSFQITGIHRTTMAAIRNKLMTECPAINAIEPMFMTDQRGKWTVCTTLQKLKEAQTWIDDHLTHLLDPLEIAEKPPLPLPCVPQRIINYAEVSESQVKHLADLTVVAFIPGIPPSVNPWGSPARTATTHPVTTPSTLSANSPYLSSLSNKIDALQIQLNAQEMATGHQKSNNPNPLPVSVPTPSPVPVPNGKATDRSWMETSIEILQSEAMATKTELLEIRQKLASHANATAQLTDRIEDFQSHVDTQIAPLQEVTAAGGFATLILNCLSQAGVIPIPPQPVHGPAEDDFEHTPRQLFPRPPDQVSDSNSGKKRREPPSPFRASPPRGVRRDPSSPHSLDSMSDD
jgi:hypothetical protein